MVKKKAKKMKKVLIVMSSMGAGGAEKSFVSFLSCANPELQKEYDVSIELLVMTREGLFMPFIPDYIPQMETPHDVKVFCNSIGKILRNRGTCAEVFSKLIWAFEQKFSHDRKIMSFPELKWKYCGKNLKTFPKEYDTVMAYMNGQATFYAIDKVIAKRKIVWVHNDFDKLGYNLDYYRRYFNYADLIVTISDRCLESILKFYPHYRNKVIVLENITSDKSVKALAGDIVPEEYDTNCPVILSLGRLAKQKGFVDLGIEAFRIIKQNGSNAKWYIIGDGELREDFIAKIKNYNLEDSVILLGLKANPYPYFKFANIFFQPSWYEGKSIALDEAKILCKPILVTAYDTVYDSIIDHENGIIAQMNANDIAEKMQKLLIDSSLRCRLANELKNHSYGNEEEIHKYLKIL